MFITGKEIGGALIYVGETLFMAPHHVASVGDHHLYECASQDYDDHWQDQLYVNECGVIW